MIKKIQQNCGWTEKLNYIVTLILHINGTYIYMNDKTKIIYLPPILLI